MSNSALALALVEAVSSSGAVESSSSVAETAIDNAGDVAEAVVHEVGETVRNESDNAAQSSNGPVDDTTMETLIKEVADVIKTYISETHETERERIQAEADGEPSDEEVDESIEFEPQKEPEGARLFVNFGEETLGPDGQPIFGGRPNMIVIGQRGRKARVGTAPAVSLPSSVVALNAVGLLSDSKNIKTGAGLVRTASFKLKVQASGKSGPGALPLLVGLLELAPQRIEGHGSFASVQITSRMGRSSTTWSARASTGGDTHVDDLMFGKPDVSKTAVSIRNYAAIGLPVDMAGTDSGVMSVDIRVSVGIE